MRLIRCSARTIGLEEERLSIVKKHFGDVPLSAITATTIADFQHARHAQDDAAPVRGPAEVDAVVLLIGALDDPEIVMSVPLVVDIV